MRIFQGSFKDYREKLIPMFHEHWDEIGMSGTEGLELDPNYSYYSYLESFGRLVGVGIETDDGELVGYIVFILFEHPHHRYVRFAMTDCFLIKKEYRVKARRNIIRMFRFAEKILKGKNISYIQLLYDHKNNLWQLGNILGYKPSNAVMIKGL